jgi:hypothetical protein
LKTRIELLLLPIIPLFLACLATEADFHGKTEIKTDGSLIRSGRLEITASGESDSMSYPSALAKYFSDNFMGPNDSIYDVRRSFADSSMIIGWTGSFKPRKEPAPDYIHIGKDKTKLTNHISLEKRDRWFFSDYFYEETFSDPIDTAEYWPAIENQMMRATTAIMNAGALASIDDIVSAHRLLKKAQAYCGIEMMRLVVQHPDSIERLTSSYEKILEDIADSIAALPGNGVRSDNLSSLLISTYNAAWDTVMNDNPGIFGNYGIIDSDQHRFQIEVVSPGFITCTNADSVFLKSCIWKFDRQAFFAKVMTLEVVSRRWAWGKTFLTLAVVVTILVVSLRPKKSRGAGAPV